MPDQSPPGGDARPHVEIPDAQNVIILNASPAPKIPHAKARTCPQCGRDAWAESRYCWHCKFDFDKAALPPCHPAKLLLLSASLNLVAAALLLARAITEHCP